jgi:hypothetical protein
MAAVPAHPIPLLSRYGFPEEKTKGENLQTQAPQAHEGEPPQEAFAL